jgi:hypothetical protein
MEILQTVTEYGIGWVIAAYFIRENKELHIKLQQLTLDAIKGKMALAERLEKLTDVIKTRLVLGNL